MKNILPEIQNLEKALQALPALAALPAHILKNRAQHMNNLFDNMRIDFQAIQDEMYERLEP